jgi:hypothetical protein
VGSPVVYGKVVIYPLYPHFVADPQVLPRYFYGPFAAAVSLNERNVCTGPNMGLLTARTGRKPIFHGLTSTHITWDVSIFTDMTLAPADDIICIPPIVHAVLFDCALINLWPAHRPLLLRLLRLFLCSLPHLQ